MKSANNFVKQKERIYYSGDILDDTPFVFEDEKIEPVVEAPVAETTFEDVMITYNESIERAASYRKKNKESYELLGDAKVFSYRGIDELHVKFASYYAKYGVNKLDFKGRWTLLSIINALLYKDQETKYEEIGIYLRKIKEELEEFEDTKDYLYNEDGIKGSEQQAKRCLLEDISFDTMYDSKSKNIICSKANHFFIKLEGELRCVFCGASTKEYDLTPEQLEFLEKAADAQKKLIKGVTAEDMPLLQLLVMERTAAIEEYDKELDNPINNSEDKDEMYYDFDETVHRTGTSIQNYIARAKRIDSGDYTDKWGNITYFQKYFDDERATRELAKVEEDLEVARTMSLEPESRRNTVQRLKIKKYEILILSGKTIPGIFERLTDDEDKECFVKAYANLNDEEYRKNSGYFEGKKLGSEVMYPYSCITAIPEINRRLLDMKLKNTNN